MSQGPRTAPLGAAAGMPGVPLSTLAGAGLSTRLWRPWGHHSLGQVELPCGQVALHRPPAASPRHATAARLAGGSAAASQGVLSGWWHQRRRLPQPAFPLHRQPRCGGHFGAGQEGATGGAREAARPGGTGGGGGGERAGHTWGWGGRRGGKTITDKRKKDSERGGGERQTDKRQTERERDISTASGLTAEPAERREGPAGWGLESNAPRQWRGPLPTAWGRGGGGGGGQPPPTLSHRTTRVNDGGRAGCPGQEAPRQGERESRVSQSSSPPPPSPPPPPRPPPTTTTSSQGSSAQRGGKPSHTAGEGPTRATPS